jgi:hypothetical protein
MKKWQNRCVELSEVLKAGFGRIGGGVLSFDTKKINDYLTKLDQDGWEVVSVVPTIGAHGTENKILIFIKREVQEAQP